ncbi:hypothetical protein CR513_43473, partial [Mucuna pruriens]
MKRMFLENFFPLSRTTTNQKEICGIWQHFGETWHEYWERFKKLCTTCPQHQISEQLLLQHFYEALLMMDGNMVDATSGGALMDKTPATTRHLISSMTSNMQQFRIRGGESTTRVVSEFGAFHNLQLENQLTELRSLVRGSHTNQIRIKGSIQDQGLNQPGSCWVRVKPIINNRVRDTKHQHSANTRNSKCHLNKILPQ